MRLFFLCQIHSYLQAFAQCENAITKLRVIRESYDDTAGAAEVAHENSTSLFDFLL